MARNERANKALDFYRPAVLLTPRLAVVPRIGAPGNIPYSAVIQPSPLPRIKPGTEFSTAAVQMTLVFPIPPKPSPLRA